MTPETPQTQPERPAHGQQSASSADDDVFRDGVEALILDRLKGDAGMPFRLMMSEAEAIIRCLMAAGWGPTEGLRKANELMANALQSSAYAARDELQARIEKADYVELLRLASRGRAEYVKNAPADQAAILVTEANTFASAANLLEDPTRIGLLIPTWMPRDTPGNTATQAQEGSE